MHIEQHANKVTDGTFVLNERHLWKFFPETEMNLLSYVVAKHFVNAGDPRVSYREFSPRGWEFNLSCKSKVRQGDEFSETFGVNMIRGKLHKRADRLIRVINTKLSYEIDGLQNAIQSRKIKRLKLVSGLDEADCKSLYMDIFISDTKSDAVVDIPFTSFPQHELSIKAIIDDILSRMRSYLLQSKRVNRMDVTEIDGFLEFFKRELDREFLEQNIMLGTKFLRLKAKTTRHKEDEHDPEAVRKALTWKLWRAWVKINKRIADHAIKLLEHQRKFFVPNKWSNFGDLSSEQCSRILGHGTQVEKKQSDPDSLEAEKKDAMELLNTRSEVLVSKLKPANEVVPTPQAPIVDVRWNPFGNLFKRLFSRKR